MWPTNTATPGSYHCHGEDPFRNKSLTRGDQAVLRQGGCKSAGSTEDNNFIKDFPQLADGLMVIPLPVEEQCRGVLSEPLPNLQLLTGDAQFSEGMGYPMVQQWRVRSNLYKVKLSAITLSTGFSKVLKAMTADSTRDELLSFIQQYGSHYISEALYGSELTCNIYFPSKKTQQQLWLQYQKGKGGGVIA
ncbi:hypothetical protein MHYP_G00283530 [Metynnis hypsauchen]